jgi:CrcB protein
MQQLLLIAVGGSLGAIARYGISTYVLGMVNDVFPWGTLLVNGTGAFLIGVFVELFDAAIVPPPLRSFIAIGFLGAYTTFSTFSLETINLFRDGEIRLAAMNVLASNILSIALVAAGIYASRTLVRLFS